MLEETPAALEETPAAITSLQYIRMMESIKHSIITEAMSGYTYLEHWGVEFAAENLAKRVTSLQVITIEYMSARKPDPHMKVVDFIEANADALLPAPYMFTKEELDTHFPQLWEVSRFSFDKAEGRDFSNYLDEGSKIRLIPLWLQPFLNPNLTVYSIDGEPSSLKDADKDHRGGYMAFGFHLTQDNTGSVSHGFYITQD